MLPKVAIVGRPNVGKSTLFNRIIGERLSITDNQPGVTRDRIYAKGTWLSKEFSLIDTGGIELGDAPFLTEIKTQADIAMEEADVIVFVVDCRSGVTDNDSYIAKLLYKTNKPVLLAVNKVDDQKFRDNIYEFYALGFGDPIPISSSHGIGTGNLLDQIIENLPKRTEEVKDDAIKFCLIGRPNVGKSSLTNCLLNDNRNRLSKDELEARLKDLFGLRIIVWLNHGFIKGDDTDSHVDTLARFIAPNKVAYAACLDENDEHYKELNLMKKELENAGFELVALPLPKPVFYNGKRLGATYCNFIFINGAVIVPTYGDKEADDYALNTLKDVIPNREIIGVDSRVFIRQNGSLHCSSQNRYKRIK